MIEKLNYLRSPRHRRIVASLDCIKCGAVGRTQAAHTNFGKGLGMKACDSQLMALCVECHRDHDQGAIYGSKFNRWKAEAEMVDATRAVLIRKHLWMPDVEAAYKKAYARLKAVVETIDEKKAASRAA